MGARTARSAVLDALLRLEKDKSYSNLVLDAFLRKYSFSNEDKSFASRLFYGVIERKLTLDYIVSQHSNKPPDKLDLPLRVILWMGLYQLLYMQTPDSAAVNESVRLADAVKPAGKGFVNAVLRQFVRNGKEITWPDRQAKPEEYFSMKYSCPVWLVKQYHNDYGLERMEQILETSLEPAPVTLRVNPLRTTAKELVLALREEGVETFEGKLTNCLTVAKGNAVATKAFQKGLFHVQDMASQLCSLVVVSQKPQTVFDLCAAPGGKTFTVAEEIAPYGGKVLSFDLHPKRVSLIIQGASRLGLEKTVTARQGDASVFDAEVGQADCVLCDVPCSGLGVIRRKPEIKYKPEGSLNNLPLVQCKILENAANYLRPGGTLVYSTCSLSKLENEQVVEAFLKKHREFMPRVLPKLPFLRQENFQETIFPDADGPDGFYLALMQRAE